MLSTTRRHGRPSRAEIDPAALDLISRYGSQVLATARRYSLNADDAEDAYQRGLEILLTKAPTTHEDELVPWLKTVVKHEAFAIRRQRERTAPVGGPEGVLEREGGEDETGEHAERYERLRLGAEALGRLKPQEVRCLLLRAEGYSYRQICELTGWTYTKVNRCLTEGRAAFAKRLDGIQSGAECERLAPQLSVLADGEASAADMAALRPHLRGCLACRARLREYRAAPQRVAALVPPAALAGGGGHGPGGWLESLLGWVSERGTSLTLKAQGAMEVASAQKVAAVAASTAVLAGSGVATVKTLDPQRTGRDAGAAGTTGAGAATAAPTGWPVPAPAPSSPSPRRTGAGVAADASRAAAGERRSDREATGSGGEAAAEEFELSGAPSDSAPSPAPQPAPSSEPSGTGGAPQASSGGAPSQGTSGADAEFGF